MNPCWAIITAKIVIDSTRGRGLPESETVPDFHMARCVALARSILRLPQSDTASNWEPRIHVGRTKARDAKDQPKRCRGFVESYESCTMPWLTMHLRETPSYKDDLAVATATTCSAPIPRSRSRRLAL